MIHHDVQCFVLEWSIRIHQLWCYYCCPIRSYGTVSVDCLWLLYKSVTVKIWNNVRNIILWFDDKSDEGDFCDFWILVADFIGSWIFHDWNVMWCSFIILKPSNSQFTNSQIIWKQQQVCYQNQKCNNTRVLLENNHHMGVPFHLHTCRSGY